MFLQMVNGARIVLVTKYVKMIVMVASIGLLQVMKNLNSGVRKILYHQEKFLKMHAKNIGLIVINVITNSKLHCTVFLENKNDGVLIVLTKSCAGIDATI